MIIKNELIKICKIININPPKIIKNEELAFSYSNGSIYIINDNDIKSLFLSIHELRHYYQDLYIKNNNDEISRIWEYDFKNYDLNNYLNYHIELDAYAFSYLVLKHIYKIDYDLPNVIKSKIYNYIEKNKYLYSKIINYNI